ncbi:MAG: methyl-accepting chemotaxis protein [Nitrospirota bacterium]
MENDKIIRWEYQIEAVLKFCFAFLIAVIISSIVIYFRLAETVGKSYYEVIFTLKTKRELLLQTVILSVLLQIIVGTLCTILVLIFASHKIAGPFFRLEKVFETIGACDLTIVIRLRAKDQFKALAERLNKMIEGLKYKVKVVKASFSRFDRVSGKLKGSIERGITDVELIEMVKDLDKEISELKKSLIEFDT